METANILIVDDMPDNVRLLMKMLSERGYKIQPATSGAHALAAASLEPPDLILLDILMPDMDGYQVCAALKANERTRDIPVIFISALQQVFDKVKAFSLGGVDYITKPFDLEEVLARVETHITLRKLQQHLEERVAARTAALQASERQYRLLVEQHPDGIGILQNSLFVFVNSALCALLGRPQERLIGLPPDTDLERSPLFSLRREQQEIWIETERSEILWEGAPAVMLVMRDVTERKRREDEIKAGRKRLRQENIRLRSAAKDRYRFGNIIGKSRAMQAVYELMTQASQTDANVVIFGESGTGKDLIAQTIHELSHRRKKPFIPVNCGSIQETLFEREFFGHRRGAFTGADKDVPGFFDAACGGTLFLDEVSELSLAMQVKLLRAIEDKGYMPVGDQRLKYADVRIIAATNRQLKDMVKNGTMREDFFYRIHVIPITVPPLRERKEDIPLLVEYLVQQAGETEDIPGIPGSILDLFYQYDWPGNIRQLQNLLQRYLTLKHLEFDDEMYNINDDAAQHIQAQSREGLKHATEAFERQFILNMLALNHGHKGKTAEMLQIDAKTLYRKMKEYRIATE
ncbi:sigma-54 interaction domain-containing protein [Candidatus Moduliflexus flocculans]|uniref:Sigma-54 interaction domain-containing protein n=1 Tax=Candidatus Moduliflexus flocculans TaxID=1499966 RepID=A0A081BRI0_9BACT|nr:sigma-54 interaction domain-containing protein [Candidatus Moduliflexus flocculans]